MHLTRVRLALSLGLILALTVTALPGTAVAAGSSRKVGMGMAVRNNRSLAGFDALKARLGGNAPALWSLWADWTGADGQFPAKALLDGLVARGSAPMINWMPIDGTDETNANFRYQNIAKGKHDAYIRQFAAAAKAWGKTVILRFAYEMDGAWFPWGMKRFNNTPTNFKAAWRRVYKIIRTTETVRDSNGKRTQGAGATNVKFLWSVTHPGRSGDYSWRTLYPGSSYVQYVGFSRFNWARRDRPWTSMASLFKPGLRELNRIAPTKKVIIAETGSSPSRGNKAKWITDGYQAIYRSYPKVIAIVYFNIKVPTHPNWRLDDPARAMRAYKALAAKSRFKLKFV